MVLGRPKGIQNRTGSGTKKRNTPPPITKNCTKCLKNKKEGDFFFSNSLQHADKRFPTCKDCLKENLNVSNTESVKELLLEMNRPYLISQWLSALEESKKTGKETFGLYMKTIQLNYKRLTWKDSDHEHQETISENKYIHVDLNTNKFKFEVTNEMILRWGSRYDDVDDYMKLEEFYHRMKSSNKIETHQEETYLKKLAVISLKMDTELEDGNYDEAKKLGDLFSKYMADSKFRAMDKTEADKTGGIRNFSTIFSEVEKDGHIPPWEYYKKLKNIDQDIVDKTIMHIENFTLRLNKIERMIEPPDDTPKLNDDEYERNDNE